MKKTIECFLSREWSDRSINIIAMERSTPLINTTNNQQDEDIILFLAQMHVQSKKIRPMTCAPHTICVQSGYT